MTRLSRYILRQCLTVFGGLTLLALLILLLERLLRIFRLVSNSSDTVGDATRMILNLLPYYLGLAIPAALFLGIMITTDRLSRSSELPAAFGAGVSLTQVSRPFVLLAVLLSAFTLILSGYFQPMSRYNYRQIVDTVKQKSFEAAFQEGKFAQVGNRVFWTDEKAQSGTKLGNVFILEDAGDGSFKILTAPVGGIDTEEGEEIVAFNLINGDGVTISRDKGFYEALSFQRLDWNISQDLAEFRLRGVDPHELTLPELVMLAKDASRLPEERQAASTYMHAQLGRAFILLLLPFVAIPLGLGYGRSFQSSGIAAGIVLLLIIQKSLEIGESMAEKGKIAAWAGTWPVVSIVIVLAVWLFTRSAFRVATPPLMLLSFDIGSAFTQRWAKIRRLFSR